MSWKSWRRLPGSLAIDMTDIDPPIFKRDIERLAQQLFVRSADTTPPGKYCSQEELNEFNLRKMQDCFRVADQFIKYKNSL
jgi:hypothetical protein